MLSNFSILDSLLNTKIRPFQIELYFNSLLKERFGVMEYKMMIPPFEVGNFRELNKKQSDEHFKWYISQIPFRMEQLQN